MDSLDNYKILENLPRGIMLLDEQNKIIMQNSLAESLIAHLEGKDVSELEKHVAPECFNIFHNKLNKIREEQSIREVMNMEAGNNVLSLDLSRLNNKAGQFSGIRIFIENITHMIHFQNYQENLFKGVVYNLRNSITTLLGWVEITKDMSTDNEVIDIINNLWFSGENMRLLVENLSYLFTLDHASKRDIPLKKVSLKELINEVSEKCSIFLDKKHCSCDSSTENIEILAWKDLLVHCLINLVHNSSKHSPDGCSIEISATVSGSSCEISVKDKGDGISQEDLPKIFDLFYRSGDETALDSSASGIGLYIVKKTCELLDWRVWVESMKNVGTRVTIKIPLLEGDNAQ